MIKTLSMVWFLCAQIALAGRITSIAASNSTARVQYNTILGNAYQLQQVEDITTTWWCDSCEVVEASSAKTETAVTVDASHSFFRVLEFEEDAFWYDWDYRYQSAYLSSWGLGTAESSYQHLDRAYDWYIDQANTGAAKGNNCGPASAVMAIKWYNASFSGTAEEARDWSYGWRANGWWYTSDIVNYLNLHGVPNSYSSFVHATQLQGLISEGKLLILCIDTGYLTRNANSGERVGRFYSYTGGHFLVVKGARIVSETLYLEVYDPNNWNKTYGDGTPKGKNRHIKGTDLALSIENWWANIIVIDPFEGAAGGGTSTQAQQTSQWLIPVDPENIEHARGR